MALVLEAGSTFGRYRVHKRIARGGMADVWYGTSYGLGGFRKRVVIKTIRPELARDPEYVELLINEASLAAQLSHPNIVQVFDLGRVGGIYFIAMEYLPGRTFAQVLQRVRRNRDQIPTWLALSAVASCCEGLQYAHDMVDAQGKPLGMLHQDLSPGNIMLSFNGNVTILDFGVARATLSGGERPRVIRGKYPYMAPERVRGEEPDRRSDVYSLGVVLYQLLTQTRPFDEQDERELARRIVSERPPRPRDIVPRLPEDVEHVVLRAMEPDLALRYPDAYSMGMDLRACLRRLGEVHEVRDRARYAGWLFPESREAVMHRGVPPGVTAGAWPADRWPEAWDDAEEPSAQAPTLVTRPAAAEGTPARGHADDMEPGAGHAEPALIEAVGTT